MSQELEPKQDTYAEEAEERQSWNGVQHEAPVSATQHPVLEVRVTPRVCGFLDNCMAR
jgi:hypothetical protein